MNEGNQREGFGGILREHSDHHTVDNLKLSAVGSGHLNEDVCGVHRDLRVIAVDDGRQRADGSIGVVNDWVDGGVTDDVKILAQLLVFLLELLVLLLFQRLKYESTCLVESHQLLSIHLLGLVQRSELDILGWQGLVGERTLDGVKIVSPDGNERSLAGQVLVKFVLKRNEGLIAGLVEFDTAQNSTGNVGSDFRRLVVVLAD